jgi:iron complex outermembrane recepter protein
MPGFSHRVLKKSIAMKKMFNLLVACTIVLCSQAQQPFAGGKVSGSIKDGGQQQVIDAATISLLKSKDSSLVKTAVTDAAGNFAIQNIKEGDYLLMATSVGYGKTYSNLFSITEAAPAVTIGVLQLVPASKNLSAVTITSKKPFIERKAGITVVNVEASVTNTGNTALEVLEKAPGVTVDKDGNISLNGKQGVMIMLDGKQTFLSGPELANMLRSMTASQLDQIEVMANPSAKYDAAGRSGIINIKTKKNKQKGFNGNLSLAYRQGVYARTNNNGSLNYKNGRVNLFSTFGFNHNDNNFQDLNIYRRYTNPDKTTKAVFEQNALQNRRSSNYNAKLGADFYVNKKTTIGIVLTGTTVPRSDKGGNTSYLKNSAGAVDSIVQAISSEKSKWSNGTVNLNFRHVIDSTGKELTVDVDYLRYKSDKDQRFVNTSFTSQWATKFSDVLLGELPSDISIYTAKADYTHPLKKGAKLEAGIKSSFVQTDNVAGYYNQIGNIKTPDYEKTNSFDYEENINAAYVNYNKVWKKWSLQIGLRFENTNYKGYQYGNPTKTDSSFSRTYNNLFPTIFIGYNPSQKNQFSFSYGRRINRPDYEDLNPFLFFLDKYTYGAGNPFLRPMYSNVFEVSHTYRQFLTTTAGYSRTTDIFTETFEQKDFATIVRQGNYGVMNDANVAVSAQVPVKKWWMAIAYTQVRYNQFKGRLYGEDVNVGATTLLANLTNQFTFKKGWNGELSGWYRTPGVEGQIKIKTLGQLNVGVQKQVLKNKASIKLNVNDILNSRNARGEINFQNTEARFSQRQDNRSVVIGFNWRFGKPIKGVQKRKTGGAGDEQNRVKGAN